MKLSALSSDPRVYMAIQKVFGWAQRPLLRYVKQVAVLGPGERVLDVGCGTGEFGRLFASGYVGVDPSDEYIAFARQYVPAGTFAVMGAAKLDFPDASFDRVLCTRVLHHIPDAVAEAALQEMQRVVKPGGRVDILEEVWPARWNVIGNALFALDLGKYQRHLPVLTALLEKHGFTCDAPYISGSFPVHYTAFHWQKPHAV